MAAAKGNKLAVGNKHGRPTKCTPEAIQTSIDYMSEYHSKYNHAIPSIVGLAVVLKVGKSTLYDWIKDKRNGFPDIAEDLLDHQHLALTNGGLFGDFNASIAKLILTKHGYSDKQENNVNLNDYTSKSPDELARIIAEKEQAYLKAKEE